MPNGSHPGRTECAANHNALRRQLRVMNRFQAGASQWNPLLDGMADSRPKNPTTAKAGEADHRETQIELLHDGADGIRIPVVAGEVLVSFNPAVTGGPAELLHQFGFGDGEDLSRREDRVFSRYRFGGRRADLKGAIDAVIDFANKVNREAEQHRDEQNDKPNDEQNEAAGRNRKAIEVAPNALIAMNVVTKSKSGAEPACCQPGERPSVEKPHGMVVVIDTGKFLDGHREDWLKDVDGEDDPRVDGDDYLLPSAGHGTFVAGVIRQVCPSTTVHVLDVIDADGLASDTAVAERIRDAAAYIEREAGAGVINLSIGDETYRDRKPLAIEAALAEVAEMGTIAVVAAAGNRNSGKKVYPAALDGVVAVASLTNEFLPSSWSNRGEWVDFSAIGEGIVSTFVEGDERPGTGRPDDPNDPEPDSWVGPKPWAVWTGTSFAAPQIAARLAEILARDGGSADAAVATLKTEILKAGTGQVITDFGLALQDPGGLMYVVEPQRPDGDPGPIA